MLLVSKFCARIPIHKSLQPHKFQDQLCPCQTKNISSQDGFQSTTRATKSFGTQQQKNDQHAYNENKFLHKVSKKEVLQMLANTKYTNISG